MILYKKKNLVSFVGTSFKDSKLNVLKSITSCLSQNYSYCEFIFVLPPYYNNLDIFKKFKDKRIKIFFTSKLENLATSLNIAIKKSKGEFIARIDFDDRHVYSKIKKQVYFLKKNKNISICGTNAILLFKNQNKQKLILPQNHDQIVKNFFFFNPIVHSSVLARRNFFLDTKIYNETFKSSEDLELWMRGIINSQKFYNIQDHLTLCNLPNKNIRNQQNFTFNYYARKLYSKKIFGFFLGVINLLLFYIYLKLPPNFKQIMKNIFYKRVINF